MRKLTLEDARFRVIGTMAPKGQSLVIDYDHNNRDDFTIISQADLLETANLDARGRT